ncbi:small, acid-soluble spore protein, alpha/beta type [Sulfobacillus harzensis]|uniref:Small, acid-soluble spore protein, alpha/beta type n=1 Tax=Sulfobacillus harzensis TaxID=2729629 RepID=A0A7Y0L3D6_9FIRM|nr:small, acid-soluble spore protein, alpha/beta type [Sulfobacillus harzensis]NMP21660.1 small, acid-soluble spore protein, alpha/beta type [Sulfobacillus harzensis]
MPKSNTPGTLKSKARSSTAKREPTPEELENSRLKVEAARALGLWEKVEAQGWSALTAAESGRIGGWMTRIRFQEKRRDAKTPNA